jgi:WhiB family redox-sensing transcriptional regulator
MNWRDRSACLGVDPELFFPAGDNGPAMLQREAAKCFCRRCEVADTCLNWAIESGQDIGIWDGLSEEERRALRSRNAPAAVPVARPCGAVARTKQTADRRPTKDGRPRPGS